MKKYFALIITVILVLTCFTACKPELKDGAIVTNAAGENYAAVTEADGGVKRDEAGNLIVLVTDEDGRNVKGEDGKLQTNPVAIDHALVIGNTIEMPTFSIQIPEGWSDSISFSDLILKRDGTNDILKISAIESKPLSEVIADHTSLINQTKTMFKDAVTENKSIEVGGDVGDAQFYSVYVADTGNGTSVYLAYAFFEHAGVSYSCQVNSNRDLSGDVNEIAGILSTINFVR